MTRVDRQACARALAKAQAFKECGKDEEAASWARQLIELLHCHDILKDA